MEYSPLDTWTLKLPNYRSRQLEQRQEDVDAAWRASHVGDKRRLDEGKDLHPNPSSPATSSSSTKHDRDPPIRASSRSHGLVPMVRSTLRILEYISWRGLMGWH